MMTSQQPYVLQRDVARDLQLGDTTQVLHPVFVHQQVAPVHGHSELLRVAQDDHLRGRNTFVTSPPTTPELSVGRCHARTSKYSPALKGKAAASSVSSDPQQPDRKEFLINTLCSSRGLRWRAMLSPPDARRFTQKLERKGAIRVCVER